MAFGLNSKVRNGNHYIANLYALEILESLGIMQPDQQAVDEIEKLLLAPHESTRLIANSLQLQDLPNKYKVLLLESEPLLLVAHQALIANLKFDIDIVGNYLQLNLESLPHYKAVFVGGDQAVIDAFLLAKAVAKLNKSQQPKICVIGQEKAFTPKIVNALAALGIKEILHIPVLFRHLIKVTQNLGILNQPNGGSHVNSY